MDHRADLYASALVLYCLVVGHGAFDGLHEPNLLAAQIDWQRHPPSTVAVHPIAPELDRVILRGLLPDPHERFQSAEEFDAALAAVFPARGKSRMATPMPSGDCTASHLPLEPEAAPTALLSGHPESAPAPMVETAVPSTHTAGLAKRTSPALSFPTVPVARPSWTSVYVVVVACATLLTVGALAASLVVGRAAVHVGTPLAIAAATALGVGMTRHKQKLLRFASESREREAS